jgi:hypothetical protein
MSSANRSSEYICTFLRFGCQYYFDLLLRGDVAVDAVGRACYDTIIIVIRVVKIIAKLGTR